MNPQQAPAPVSYNSGSGRGKSILVTGILVVLLIAALAFGGWAFTQMQDYKTKSDQKAAAAVAAATKSQATTLQAQFDEQSKSPNKTFVGSPTYGTVSFNYPKSWSGYVDTSNTSEPINAYFHPDVVPGVQAKAAYSLRLELLSTDYAQVLQQFASQIKTGTVKAAAYTPPKLSGVTNVQPGTLLTGQINNQDTAQTGTLLVIKVRDKTLLISTQSNEFLNDYKNTILPSLSFAP
ncbi:hypothetical protein KW803_00925 [Candidatus Saccharibacteria bacterium]|nr:hypothetical protein [Candidatus Saccharibacteria bacterium]